MKPILFNTEMIRAILDGRKTVTRRVVRFPPGLTGSHQVGETGNPDNPIGLMWVGGIKRPPYQFGDILYVRETWNGIPANEKAGIQAKYWYKADDKKDADTGVLRNHWHPSIHMPKEAARIFLRVTGVRAERLQDMETPDDKNYIAEGAKDKHDFIYIWNDTIRPAELDIYGWYANPWVWVIEFERISKEEAGL